METLKEAGFKGTRAARGKGMELALGTLATGELVLVAKTLKGEGYTKYNTYPEALLAFDRIVLNANMVGL